MKTTTQFLKSYAFYSVFACFLFLTSCEKDIPEPTVTSQGQYVPGGSGGGGGGGTCTYTPYSNAGVSCSSGYIPVTSTTCCPTSSPYYCSTGSYCYSSCESARTSCSGYVIKGESSGGGTCTYTPYYGSGCSTGYVAVSSTSCCPSSSPYTCSTSSYCYTTCAAAQSGCSGYVIKGM